MSGGEIAALCFGVFFAGMVSGAVVCHGEWLSWWADKQEAELKKLKGGKS